MDKAKKVKETTAKKDYQKPSVAKHGRFPGMQHGSVIYTAGSVAPVSNSASGPDV